MTSLKTKKKELRSGFTTGACSAAAAKGATLLLLQDGFTGKQDIPFPDGSRHRFRLIEPHISKNKATVSTKKDAGDDPDVTNGAIISATAQWCTESPDNSIEIGNIILQGGPGVGTVTKPGLAIPPGEPAINPVPRKMIAEAVHEAFLEAGYNTNSNKKLSITISVARGKELAKKTLNGRLGIIGGISILGTTGIVRPVSAHAWKATISASMDVAKSTGLEEIVISTGRTSEKGVQSLIELPEEAYAMMGDYLHFSLEEAAKRNFSKIHYAGMWAKIMKAALRIPQTHVRNGSLEIAQAVELLRELGAEKKLCVECMNCNTAREILVVLQKKRRDTLIAAVCQTARNYAEEVTGKPVTIYLVNHKAEVIFHT